MATKTTVIQATQCSETPKLPTLSLVSEDTFQQQEHAPTPASQTREFGQLIQIHGIDGVKNSAIQPLDISDFGCHDTCTKAPSAPQAYISPVEPETPLLDAINHAPADIDGLPMENVPILEEPHQEQQSSQRLELAEQISNDEWQHQNMQFHEHRNIHHFNFLGDGVPCKNATPPAVSLLVSVSGAKAGFAKVDDKGEADPHGYALMRNAMRLVDPVIYHGPAEDLELRGESLREAATGVCDKFYSEHGTWRNDEYREEDRPSVDHMDVLAYPIGTLPVNGWFQSAFVMDREDLHTLSYNTAKWEEQKQQESLRYRRTHKPNESPLRQMLTMEDLDGSMERKKTEVPDGATPLETSHGAKNFDSSWTVDLDKFLGKCDDWSDEVDDDDEAALIERNEGSPVDASSDDDEAGMTDEPEAEKQSPPVGLATTAPDSDIVSVDNASQEPVITGNERSADQNDGPAETFVLQSAIRSSAIHGPLLKKDIAFNALQQSMDGLSEDELQAEDREIYGDSPIASQEIEVLLQQLHESQLITGDVGACSAPQSSGEDEDGGYFAPTLDSERLSHKGTFSLRIREKSAKMIEDALITSAINIDVGSSPASSNSFDLPIRGKVPVLPNHSAKSLNHHDPTALQSAETTCNHPSIRPSEPHSQKASPNQDDKDEMEAGEQMCLISDETVSCSVTTLQPRKSRARRLTDSPSELLESSLEAWSATSTSDRGRETPAKAAVNSKSTSLPAATDELKSAVASSGEMLKPFEEAYSAQSDKYRGINRSQSFPNLEQLAAKKVPLRNSQRWSSHKSCVGFERTTIDKAPKAKLWSKVEKLNSIFEDDETERNTEMCSGVYETWPGNATIEAAEIGELSVVTGGPTIDDEQDEHLLCTELDESAVSPIRSPYKRPESNTPLKMMRKSIRLDLLENIHSSYSIEEVEVLNEVEDHSANVKDAGEHFCYALENWGAIFRNDDDIDSGEPSHSSLDDVPIIGGAPLSARGSSTAADSEAPSALGLSSIFTQNTRSTTPMIEFPKTLKDVKFIRTRLPESKWGEIKEKLNAQVSRSKPSSKKTKLKKSIKTFFRKSLESFAVMGHPIF